MTSRKSLQYFLTRSLQDREHHKTDKVRIAQDRLKEHIVFCPAKYCKVYEVYRKEKKDEDAIDYTCCPPDIKKSLMERDQMPCPCEEVTCDCAAQNSHPFQPLQSSPHHRKGHRRINRPQGCTCPQSQPFNYQDRSYDRHHMNYSHNHHQEDLFNLGDDLPEEESPYFLKDLPIPQCLCQIDGCTCRNVCWDKCGVPPLFHNCGGPKIICKNIKCPVLQDVLKNPKCDAHGRQKVRKMPACVPEEKVVPFNAASIRKCKFFKKIDESEYLPKPCPIHGVHHTR